MIHAGFESVIFQILIIWVIANKIFGKKKIAEIISHGKSAKQKVSRKPTGKTAKVKSNFLSNLVKGLEDELGEFSGIQKKKPKHSPSLPQKKQEPYYKDPFFDNAIPAAGDLQPFEQPLDSDVVFKPDHLDSKLPDIPDFHTDTALPKRTKKGQNLIKLSGSADLKKAFILKEILDKPLSLRPLNQR